MARWQTAQENDRRAEEDCECGVIIESNAIKLRGMLRKLRLSNYTVFEEADLEFSPNLNVIIGENGGGKSHVLKAIYSLIAASAEERIRASNSGDPTIGVLKRAFAEKMIATIRPESLGRLTRRHRGRQRSEIQLDFEDDSLNTKISFATNSITEVTVDHVPRTWQQKKPVFIPTRELLSIYPGFVNYYENFSTEFEETYRDTCILLGAPTIRGARGQRVSELLQPLERAMGGRILHDQNGRFYLHENSGARYEMHLVAEGLRKLAMVARLIATGSLLENGYLFWDEPETNLNPKLIKAIAEVILHLTSNGIQVFIASHSLFLLRELEILGKSATFNDVEQKYFSLKVTESGVEVEQGQEVSDLNTIVLLDEELEQNDKEMAQ